MTGNAMSLFQLWHSARLLLDSFKDRITSPIWYNHNTAVARMIVEAVDDSGDMAAISGYTNPIDRLSALWPSGIDRSDNDQWEAVRHTLQLAAIVAERAKYPDVMVPRYDFTLEMAYLRLHYGIWHAERVGIDVQAVLAEHLGLDNNAWVVFHSLLNDNLGLAEALVRARLFNEITV